MISVSRLPAPAQLTSTEAARLTAEFIATGSSVWNQDYIRERLLAMSHGKCAYCETPIDEESKYMEVEHFYAKGAYPNRVVDWLNLLPSCKRCNVQKGTHDVLTDGMIIDPTNVNPQSHLRLHNYRLKGKDALGRLTAETVYLNDTDRVVSVRMKVGETIMESLEKLRSDLEHYVATGGNRLRLNRAIRGLHKLFDAVEPCKEYSATAATILLSDDEYDWMKTELIKLGEWAPFAPREAHAMTVALS